jgi:hypothetical protein
MLYYHILTGSLYREAKFLGTGYSGKGKTKDYGRNNPDMVSIAGAGPIPPGVYQIGSAHKSPNTGPMTFDLTPLDPSKVYGRSLFRIHGNNDSNNASHGCIILGPVLRADIAAHDDQEITVTSE